MGFVSGFELTKNLLTIHIMEDYRRTYYPISQCITGILIMVVPLLGSCLNTISFLGIIAILLFIPVFVGVRNWVKFKFFTAK